MTLTLYTMPNCPHCNVAKQALDQYGFEYTCVTISDRGKRHAFYDSIADDMAVYPENVRRTMPKLYTGDVWVPSSQDIIDMCRWGIL